MPRDKYAGLSAFLGAAGPAISEAATMGPRIRLEELLRQRQQAQADAARMALEKMVLGERARIQEQAAQAEEQRGIAAEGRAERRGERERERELRQQFGMLTPLASMLGTAPSAIGLDAFSQWLKQKVAPRETRPAYPRGYAPGTWILDEGGEFKKLPEREKAEKPALTQKQKADIIAKIEYDYPVVGNEDPTQEARIRVQRVQRYMNSGIPVPINEINRLDVLAEKPGASIFRHRAYEIQPDVANEARMTAQEAYVYNQNIGEEMPPVSTQEKPISELSDDELQRIIEQGE